MKLLFISHKFYPDIGGIEVNSEILASHFKNFGAEVLLLTWTQEAGNKSFPFKVVRNPSLTDIAKAHIWADIVYENNPSLKLSWPLLFTNKPNVVAIRTWISRMDGNMAFQDKLKLKWLKRASDVIAVSKEVRDKTFLKSNVIGNPYRSELFRILPEIQRSKDFVFLGRLVSDKGADMAIRLIADLAKKGQYFELTIIGDGEQRNELAQLSEELGVANSVLFTGMLRGAELVEALNSHRFLIAPSRWKEPFGNIALEGMACGCIPIVSDGGGLVDAVGLAGIVFERNNQLDMLHKVSNMLANEDELNRLKNAASSHLKNHAPDVVATAYYRIIEKALVTKHS